MERTVYDLLHELLGSPASLWSAFIICTSLLCLGIYIGATSRYVLNMKDVMKEVVTKKDLELALGSFLKQLDNQFQSIPLCEKEHEQIERRLTHLESLSYKEN